MKVVKCMVMFFLIISSIQAKNYYFSAEGDDTKSGLKPNLALQNLNKLNRLNLKAGDSVLFRRGDTFTGEIVVKQSGQAGKPIVFAAYGKGKLPILSGAIQLKNAKTNALNLHVFSVNQKVLKLYVNDKKQTLARTPNSGYFTTGEGIEKIGFQTTLTEPKGYWAGASVGIRTVDWIFEQRDIASFENGALQFTRPSKYNLSQGYGYFLQNKIELLDTIGEWFSSEKELNFLFDKNINAQKVEAVIYQNAFVILPSVKNIVINSLKIEKYAASGVWAQQGSGNINIEHNEIGKVGLMGVWLDTLVCNSNVKYNVIEDVAGRGVSGIRNQNCNIEHNRIHRIGLWPGEGVSGVNGMEAIVIENQEKNHALSNAGNNRIAYNEVDSTGYAGIRMDGKNSVCEYNVVKNTSLKLNDSGAIYCFGKVKGRTHNNRIANNLIINAVGNTEATPLNDMATNGIYIDNNSTQILVENNTVIHASSNGIFVNDASPNNIVRGNTTFDCVAGIAFSEWMKKDSLFGCTIDKNTTVCTERTQNSISILTYMGSSINVGKFTNNTYINAHDGFFLKYRTDPEKGQRRTDLMRLTNWQKLSGEEQGSRSLELKDAKIIYNDSFVTQQITLPKGQFADLEGNELGETVQLEACASLIIVPQNVTNYLQYQNPIINSYLADPFVHYEDGYYYFFATGEAKDKRFIPIYRSRDLASWEFIRGAVAKGSNKTDWNYANFWAPEVLKIEGKYYLYYTAISGVAPTNSGNRVGVAIADSIQGPYKNIGIVVPNGSIDGHPVIDKDGTMYIFYTNEWNSTKGFYRGTIYMDKMISPTQVADKPIPVITHHDWQEGPFILQRNNKYYLSYSCGAWSDSTYHLRYALADSITGPYVEQPDTIIQSNKMVKGPGHHSIFQDQIGRDWLVYHGWDIAHTARYPRIDPLFVNGNKMSSNGPTFTPQRVKLN